MCNEGGNAMKKPLTFYIILIMSISLFTSCSSMNIPYDDGTWVSTGEAAKADAANQTEKNPVTLTTVSMYGGTDPNAGNYQEMNEQFMNKYNYITIEDDSQNSNQDWKTKIAADFAVGNEPDVIQFFTDANASDVLAANKFVTIDEIRAVYPEYAADTLTSALEAAANPDGVQRAVPTTGYWEGMFCNKDLFDRYHLELPNTWDNLEEAIRVFSEEGIVPIAVSLNEVPHYWIENLLLSSAGTNEYELVPETAPESWIRGLKMLQTLKEMGAFPEDTDSIDNSYAETLFYEKKAAMRLDGSWFLNGISDQENTVVCSFPVMEGGKAEQGSMVGGISSGFYITKKAWEDPDKRDAAVKYVTAHTCPEAVQKYWKGIGQAVCDIEPPEGMTALALSGFEYSKAAVSISAPTDARISQEAYNVLVAGIVDVAAGDASAEELLNKVLKINAR